MKNNSCRYENIEHPNKNSENTKEIIPEKRKDDSWKYNVTSFHD